MDRDFLNNHENGSSVSQKTKPPELSAKQKLVSIGYNVPIEKARQEYVTSLDIPNKYRQRFSEIQEN